MLHIRTTFLRLTGRPVSWAAVCASIRVPQVGLSEAMRVTAFATAMSTFLSTGLFLYSLEHKFLTLPQASISVDASKKGSRTCARNYSSTPSARRRST